MREIGQGRVCRPAPKSHSLASSGSSNSFVSVGSRSPERGGLTPKNLNKTFPRVVAVLLEQGVSRAAFAKAFVDQDGPAVRFPADSEFRSAISSKPIYELILKKERLADILWELELRVRDKFSVGTPRPPGMSIEHVLPQFWAEHWLLPDGRKAPRDLLTSADEEMLSAIATRQGILHTLGTSHVDNCARQYSRVQQCIQREARLAEKKSACPKFGSHRQQQQLGRNRNSK